MNTPEGFRLWRPGRLPYRDALLLQEQLVAARPGWDHDLLVLLEHPPVITLGRGARREHLLSTAAELAAAGIDCCETSRGGDVTCHEPGQLVGYPVVDLAPMGCDLHRFLRGLEEVLVRTLGDFGLAAQTLPGRTGVWIGARKIASLGIAVRRWISWHGFALNVCNDLRGFAAIVPCGLAQVEMTSMGRELDAPVAVDAVSDRLVAHFSAVFARPLLGDYDPPTAPQTRLA